MIKSTASSPATSNTKAPTTSATTTPVATNATKPVSPSESRLLALRHDSRLASVEGDDPRLIPGVAFDLIGHPRPDLNHGWRAVRIGHPGVQYTSQAQQSTRYHYSAQLIPDRVEWKPLASSKPLIPGPQVATVVGPADEELYVDEHGWVKVQFPWDR